jgi:hypothetical protein
MISPHGPQKAVLLVVEHVYRNGFPFLRTAPVRADRGVGLWLFVIALMIGLMVVVGGLTRLTGSGLSITEWQPVTV